jgi:acetyl-CoA acetyltransferase family protein
MKKLYGTDGMGQTAENLVDLYKISREDQDLFAYNSQMKATKAKENSRLSKEICTVKIPQRKKDDLIFSSDEFIKPHTSLEKLKTLRPAFRKENGTVTAGNSSGLNDGAAALIIGSENAAKKNHFSPMARIVGAAVAGVEPRIMGIGPVEASKKVLKRTGLTLDQIDIIEINEAFSAQSLACTRAMNLEDNDPRINPNGGAIAIGHPLGMTGARLLQTAAIELKSQNKKYALVTMCIGVGQGYATIIEKP